MAWAKFSAWSDHLVFDWAKRLCCSHSKYTWFLTLIHAHNTHAQHMLTYLRWSVYIFIRRLTHIYLYIYMWSISNYTQTYINIYIHTNMSQHYLFAYCDMYIPTHSHTHIFRMHTHTHTHTQIDLSRSINTHTCTCKRVHKHTHSLYNHCLGWKNLVNESTFQY